MSFPLTLWRYMTVEIWRLVAITTLVLVCVVSFAAVVKFLAEGKLGPVDALRFMAVIAVPMLHYTLPFASGFGATLAYHRMTADGELTAAHAGGISHKKVLAPALGAAIVLGGVLATLNQGFIPHLLRSSHRMISANIAEIVKTSIESSQSIAFDNFLLHADGVKSFGPDAASGASERLLLTGVVAVEFDRKGNIRSEATAARAWLWIFPPGGETPAPGSDRGPGSPGSGYVRMRLEEGVGVSGGQLVRFAELVPDPWILPDSFRNDPKFFSNAEMDTLRKNPELMHGVEQRRLTLAQRLAERQTLAEIKTTLISDGRARLVDALGQPVVLRASDVRLTPERRWNVIPHAPGQPVAVDRYMPDGTLSRYTARAAEIVTQLDDDPTRRGLSVRLVLTDVSAAGGVAALPGANGSGVSGDRAELVISPLYAAGRPLEQFIGLRAAELIDRADPYVNRERPDPFVKDAVDDLRDELQELDREIMSKVHERWAMSAACLVMAVAGAVTAMRLGNALPLTVYLWSFFPALAGVITITSGQQVVHDVGAPGLAVLWGGVALLGAYTLGSYIHVARH